MKNTFYFTVIILFLLPGCVSTYNLFNPTSLQYDAKSSSNNITLRYKHDVLKARGNKRYVKKEEKKHITIIAISITNDTEGPITFGQNANFYQGNSKINLLETELIYASLKQPVAPYALYLLLTPLNGYYYDGYTTTVYPIGYLLGPGLALTYSGIAISSNKKFKNDLMENNLIGKTVLPGETIYGVIGVGRFGYGYIELKIED